MALNVVLNGQDSVNQNNFYGTVGTTAVPVLLTSIQTTSNASVSGIGQLRQFLCVHNPSASGGNSLAFTTDGTTPAVGAAGITLYPGASAIYNVRVPPGPVTVVGSSASTPYTIISI